VADETTKNTIARNMTIEATS